jgi:peptidylprolyl isomerase
LHIGTDLFRYANFLLSTLQTQAMAKQDYILKNREWLAAKATEPGVKPIDKGIYYKQLKKGNGDGRQPNPGSIVTVHYVGKTINGKTFDSSRGGTPPAFRLRELIPGWIIALRQMRPGDRWEVYIPAEQAYGKFSQPGIPGGSTLIFDIELIAVM